MSWAPATDTELKALADQIVREIGTEYVIAYTSERASDDEAFHAIKVYTTQPGIHVRSRRGVYSDSGEQQARTPRR